MTKITKFFDDEDGAVTVDWVILTAAIVLFSIGVSSILKPTTDAKLIEISEVIGTEF